MIFSEVGTTKQSHLHCTLSFSKEWESSFLLLLGNRVGGRVEGDNNVEALEGLGRGGSECMEEMSCPGVPGETEMRKFQNLWFN